MDQTIRKILELDAATEERLSASRLQCRKQIEDSRKQANALKQAQRHHTRDSITELEEQTRSEFEQKIAAVRSNFDQRAEAMSAQFSEQHDALLTALFSETLHEAEA